MAAESALVAVSGGADSVFLLHHLIASEAKRSYHVAHVNHAQRGAESDADEAFVQEHAHSLNLPFHATRLGPFDGPQNEADLRDARLAALKSIAREVGTTLIYLGHHREDLAETFLMNAMRGSGPRGLAGMSSRRTTRDGFVFVRPLLELAPTLIRESLRARGISWREDASNADARFRRNALRAQVMPLLESIQPGAVEGLAQAATLVGEMREAVAGEIARAAGRVAIFEGPTAVLLETERLAAQPFAMVPMLIQEWVEGLQDGAAQVFPPRRTQLAEVVGWLAGEGGERTWKLPGGVLFHAHRQWIVITCEATAEAGFFAARSALPYALEEGDGLHRPAIDDLISLPNGHHKTVLDAMKEAHVPRCLRPRLHARIEGDRLTIPGVRE